MARAKKSPLIPPALVKVMLLSVLVLIVLTAVSRKNDSNKIGENGVITNKTELDITVCDPANGPFTLNIDNPYFPQEVNSVKAYENENEKVQVSVLDEIELVAGVETRVVEEREWTGDVLTEVSRNFFVQAPDSTVCYYGEDVDDYNNQGGIKSHGGAWRAGENGNLPGIIMPALVSAGQKYRQEVAPGTAEDRAEHLTIIETYPAGDKIYEDVLIVKETPDSDKRYAKGIGLIYDDGMILVD